MCRSGSASSVTGRARGIHPGTSIVTYTDDEECARAIAVDSSL